MILAGCQFISHGKLDKSKLSKVKMNDVSEEQQAKIPLTYEAPSLEVGLKALPFAMKLPEKLPFAAKPFQPPIIEDFNHNGQQLLVRIRTSSEDEKDQIILHVQSDFPVNEMTIPNMEEVELDKKMIGYYNGKALNFIVENVAYSIIYLNPGLSPEQHKKEIMEMANQMLNQ